MTLLNRISIPVECGKESTSQLKTVTNTQDAQRIQFKFALESLCSQGNSKTLTKSRFLAPNTLAAPNFIFGFFDSQVIKLRIKCMSLLLAWKWL